MKEFSKLNENEHTLVMINIHPNDTRGLNYQGTVNVTVSGRKCQNWRANVPHRSNVPHFQPSYFTLKYIMNL